MSDAMTPMCTHAGVVSQSECPWCTIAEQAKRIERLTDLVRYCRHTLHQEGLISNEEFSEIVFEEKNPGAVRRLGGYDEMRNERDDLEVRCAELEALLPHKYMVERDRLKAANRGLREALEPFAAEGRRFPYQTGTVTFSMKQLQAAARVLRETNEEG